ncbi:MAG: phosphonate C-P lyase system protein PhnH [Rhodobacteraceae bacterium]|nr:phosphonate C-P lyase system protein PhnH [Paracoccaceae bacterium]
MALPQPTPDDLRDTATFEALMWAMARPGTIQNLPEGISDLALALLDRETRVHVEDPALARCVAATGASMVEPSRADHAFCATAEGAMAALAVLPVGSALYPDEGATLVMPAIIGTGPLLRLTGPGIDGHSTLRLGGLPEGLLDLRSARCRYPEGIDLVFVDGRRLVGLPRSTAVEVL